MKRICLFGGVFDPVHEGHIAVARYFSELLSPDEFLILPSGCPPHKTERRVTDGADRLAMLRIAMDGLPVTVCDYELRKSSFSYTVETLRHFREVYGEEAELIWVIGADNAETFFDWYHPQEILSLARIAVISRPGFDLSEARRKFPNCIISEELHADLSSRGIRAALRQGIRPDGLPDGVWEYLQQHRLYPKQITLQQAQQEVGRLLGEHRARHTFGVRDTAAELAERFGASKEAAELAALLHDITKQRPLEEQLALCRQYHLHPDPMQQTSTALLHAVTAEAESYYHYGIDSEDLLGAIRYHTTGCADMTPLMKIIYLADCIEPNREPYPDLEKIRALARHDLDGACLMSLERGLAYLTECGKPIHPDTVAAAEFLKRQKERE